MKPHSHAYLVAMLLLAIIISPKVVAEENAEGWQPRTDIIESWSKRRAPGINYREDKVPDYTLPELLVSRDGNEIQSPEAWNELRRPEILQLFREHVYGVRPDTDYTVDYQEVARRDNAFGVGATALQIRATIKAKGKSHAFEFVFVTPKADGPVPLVVLINNRYFIPLDKAVEESDPFWPVQTLVRKGYATASFHTKHVDPDKKDGYADGIRALLDDPAADPATRWGSLSAWGWGASRVLDYVLEQPMIDVERTAVVGHSRGGKTALWAAAEDPRFKVAYSNNSGCGGAALSRRAYGETVARINKNFPHWFCGRFKSYDHKEAELPVDQHQLIALIAPRSVYVASADEDLWADPRGEYGSLLAAAPVFELFGLAHIKQPAMPALNQPRHVGSTGYHIRTGKHNLNETDWGHFLNFAGSMFER
jgi:pimeloyl-ACP methyl ester carboxylesterase